MFESLGIMSDKHIEQTETAMNQAEQFVMNQNYLKATAVGFYGIFLIMDKFTGKMSPYSYQEYELDMNAEDPYAGFINQNKDQFGAPKEKYYEACNQGVSQAFAFDISFEQKSSVEKILQANKRVLIYNGSFDVVCNTPGKND